MLLREYLEEYIFDMPDKETNRAIEANREKKYCNKFCRVKWACRFYTKEGNNGCKTHCHLKQLKKCNTKKEYPLSYRNN